MNITIFGATGKTGRLVLERCLDRGHACTAFVRDASRIEARDGTRVVVGDARQRTDVERAVAGADAVLCCLGMSDIGIPATDFSDSVRAIVAAMHARGVRRIIAIGSAGVLPHPDGGYRNQHGLPAYLRNIAAEHTRNYETLRHSGLDWTLMCPTTLKDDIAEGHARYLYEDAPSGSEETGYADLAATIVALLGEPESYGHRVGIVSIR